MGRALTRVVFWWLLVAGWVVAVWFMWEALTTVPSAARLESSRLLAIPTVRTFFAATLFSALELIVILGLLWPWRPQLYATRLAIAALALLTWFVITIPLDLTRMDRVHRIWLLGTAVATLAALLALLAGRAVRRLRPGGAP